MEQPTLVSYVRWIVFLPLLGAFVCGLGGAAIQRAAGKRAISAIACAPLVLAFLLAARSLEQLLGLAPADRLLLDTLFTWLHVGELHADLAFAVDPLSCVMALVVTGVGGVIHFYSIGYMHEDASYWRYFAFLNLFTAAMLTLVLGDNLLLMFVGWEGVGLCSYALIGFWYSDLEKAAAGSKAFIVNRVGDFGFMLGVFLLFWTLSAAGHPTVTFRELAAHAHLLDGHTWGGIGVATLVTLLLFVGATGKSAQLPLHVWLPDAMAGPTPVSALIHAATMVTAGVYMIARLHFLFSMAPVTLHVVAAVGVVTALFAATIAMTQNDIKKVLAYSTVSQLGYMFLATGVGAYAAAIFHLVTHAFFKACLFLGSGSVIHAMGGEQDMRKMGGLRGVMPATFWTFLIATLAIAGIAPLSGFISKDEILWKSLAGEHGHALLWLVGVAVAGLTAFYMFRQVFLVFHGECRADAHARAHLHESPPIMTVPLVILAALAAVGGLLNWPALLGGASRFEHFLAPVFAAHGATAAHAAHAGGAGPEVAAMLVSLAAAGLGIAIAYAMYARHALSPDGIAGIARGAVYRWLYNKYYVDELYRAVFVNGTLFLSRMGAAFDRYVIDGIVDGSARLTTVVSWLNGLFDLYVIDGLVNAIGDATMGVGVRLRRLQTGSINGYLYVIVVGVVAVMLARLW